MVVMSEALTIAITTVGGLSLVDQMVQRLNWHCTIRSMPSENT